MLCPTSVIIAGILAAAASAAPLQIAKRGTSGAGEATLHPFETDMAMTSAGLCALPAGNIAGGFHMMASIPSIDPATACTSCIKITNTGQWPSD